MLSRSRRARDGGRLRVRNREDWMLEDDLLYVRIGGRLHAAPLREVASIEVRPRRRARSRPA